MLKKIAVFSSLLLLLVGQLSYAITPGPYAGAGAGIGEIDVSKEDFSNSQVDKFDRIAHDNGAVSGRFFGGYNFNQYVGIEAGFATYPAIEYKAAFGPTSASFSDNMNAFDIIGKVYLPFWEGRVSIFGLGGMAEVIQNVKTTSTTRTKKNHHVTSIRKLRPKFGGGISYDITPHVTASIEYSRIQGIDNIQDHPRAVPSANMVALTLSYNFG